MGGTYSDLEVWQASMDLVLRVYDITRTFPKEETYGFISQLRGAAVSIPSNVAEGKGRAYDKELFNSSTIRGDRCAKLRPKSYSRPGWDTSTQIHRRRFFGKRAE
jgi:hypothetical protein